MIMFRSASRIGAIAASVLALSAGVPTPSIAQSAIDTLLAVSGATRLEIHNLRGDIMIRTWDRNTVRLEGQGQAGRDLRIEPGGRVLQIHGRGLEHGRQGRSGSYSFTVPTGMDLTIHGMDTDVSIDGTRGRLEVGTIRGDIKVRGGRTLVQLQSVQGSVDLSGARGRIEAQSVNEPVRVTDVSGDLELASVNGGIVMTAVDSRSVEATTVNGPVHYRGTIYSDGTYSLSTHNGPIDLAVPEGTDASVDVSTFNGELEAGFPIAITEAQQGKQFRFTLGSGGARIQLQSFNGTIRLQRPDGP